MKYLKFDGRDLNSFGLIFSRENTFNTIERDVTPITIPGRNGDLIYDNGRFLNQDLPYPFAVKDMAAATELKSFLLSHSDKYYRLEDEADRTHYRMARVKKIGDFSTTQFNRHGQSTLVFDCKPQRFLYTSFIFSDSMTINNPTPFESKPIIQISSPKAGTFSINDKVITVTKDFSGLMKIDCELGDCYSGTGENLNSYIRYNRDDFPSLLPGDNYLSCDLETSGFITVEARFWEL